LVVESLWSFSLYPEAAEGGGSLSVRRVVVPSGGPPNVARAREEAVRRARVRIRRYGAANRLNRLATLTYRGEGCHDPLRLRADLAAFFRVLRDGLAAGPFAYVWVPQWHPGGHGLHAHFAVGRFVPRGLIDRCWGHGFVHIKLLDGLPVGSGERAEARLAARYLAGYAGRDLDHEGRPFGLHRYEVAQGFQPERVLVYGCSAEDVIERASSLMGSAPERVWFSWSVEGWRGPPACSARWA
jgi:hypothetical protein